MKQGIGGGGGILVAFCVGFSSRGSGTFGISVRFLLFLLQDQEDVLKGEFFISRNLNFLAVMMA